MSEKRYYVEPRFTWSGEAGRRGAEAAAALLNAASCGTVLDLSELPTATTLTVGGARDDWEAEISHCGVVVHRMGSTPAEAYNAALKAWKENG